MTKYSATGTKQWTRLTGTTLSDAGAGVAIGTSNSVYVVGQMRGWGYDVQRVT